MKRRIVPASGIILGLCVAMGPGFLGAQQANAPAGQPPASPVPAVTAPASPAPATPAPATPAPQSGDIVVNAGQPKSAPTLAPPIGKQDFDLPPGLVKAPAAPSLPPVSQAPPAKMTSVEIARQIAPRFDVARDYTRLVQCYGTADFMGAVTRVQAGRPGANPQAVTVARQIIALQDAMQPMVLAASTVRGEARFRRDYDAFAKRGQADLAKARDANTVFRPRLATLDACRQDVSRWRGGR
jgi:hypothetical protein